MKVCLLYRSGLLLLRAFLPVLAAFFILPPSTLYAQQKAVEILNRVNLPAKQDMIMGFDKSTNYSTYQYVAGKNPRYRVKIGSTTFMIDALSQLGYAKNADRVITYGDSIERHMPYNLFAKLYSGSGMVVKSMGLLARWPYEATLTEDGSFVIAGNRNEAGVKPRMFVASFDKNGNKLWESLLPQEVPASLYKSAYDNYVAVVMYNPANVSGSIRYYGPTGALLYTDVAHSGVRAIEFLPSGKAVVCSGSVWYLVDLKGKYSEIASGRINGAAVGKYPVTAHPTRPIFYLMTVPDASTGRIFLQGINSNTGDVESETPIEARPADLPQRVLEITGEDTFRLTTYNEVISFKIK